MSILANIGQSADEIFDQNKVEKGIDMLSIAAFDSGMNLLELESALWAMHQTVTSKLKQTLGDEKVNKLHGQK